MTRATTRVLGLLGALGALGLAGCQDDGGVAPGVVHVEVINEATPERGSVLAGDACFTFPVLRGGRRDVRASIDSALTLELSLTPEHAAVRFEGAASAANRRLLRAEVVEGAMIDVSSRSGADYVVVLTATCDAAAADAGP